MGMFCYQCEQTMKGTGCTIHGVCGKDPVTSTLQDLLVYATEGISMYAHRARRFGASDREIDTFVLEALFATVTNVDFDPQRIEDLIIRAAEVKEKAKALYERSVSKSGKEPETLGGPATWLPAPDREGLLRQGEEVGIVARRQRFGDEIAALQDLFLYGLKGAAAYADHAQILGHESDQVYAMFHEGLDFLASGAQSAEELLSMCLRAGEINLKAMELLDAANRTYGIPEPTKVRITPVKGKAIAVSGHDLKDLEDLLKQTVGSGINVYTHGEMLPAHAYPKLKAYSHLVGNYGSAWQNQIKEFADFPGAILMTTNCLQRPSDSYKSRIFTTGLVGWPGVTHIADKNFEPVIKAALAAPGFAEDSEERYITVGFGREAILGVAGQVIDAVKNGAIRHFFLVGGCDGAKPGRNYYTEFVEKAPKDTIILTLACGKYRFNKMDLGEIAGIPRLLDVGQCNDAYSAIQIAIALAKAFNVDVNELPLSLILSWYEQKAVAILLTLLYLGIKNIRLGPSFPAYITPSVSRLLAEKFNIMPITTAEEDLKAILRQ